MEHCGNRRQRVERLVSAWNQGTRGGAEPDGEADDPLIGASAEPKKRPRTRLTDEEVDAMRAAREQGVSVIALAHQFGVHRGTVWAKTQRTYASLPAAHGNSSDTSAAHTRDPIRTNDQLLDTQVQQDAP